MKGLLVEGASRSAAAVSIFYACALHLSKEPAAVNLQWSAAPFMLEDLLLLHLHLRRFLVLAYPKIRGLS